MSSNQILIDRLKHMEMYKKTSPEGHIHSSNACHPYAGSHANLLCFVPIFNMNPPQGLHRKRKRKIPLIYP